MSNSNEIDNGVVSDAEALKQFDEFMTRHKIIKKPDEVALAATNTRIPLDSDKRQFPGGSWHIPDAEYDEFLDLYFRVMDLRDFHFTETQDRTGIAPLVVDMDFKHPPDVQERLHTNDAVVGLVQHYFMQLQNSYTFPECDVGEEKTKLYCYVMQKYEINRDHVDKGYVKDGLHLLFNLGCTREEQTTLRLHMLDELNSYAKPPSLTNSWEDILDERVTKGSSPWPLYGSGKVYQEKYKLTSIFSCKFDECGMWHHTFRSESIDEFNSEGNFKLLTVRNRTDLVRPVPSDREAPLGLKPVPRPTERTAVCALREYELVKRIINQGMLSKPERVQHETFYKLGAALKHEFHEAGFDLWDAWCKLQGTESGQYDSVALADKWKRVTSSGMVGMGSIIFWAKSDFPKEYDELLKEINLQFPRSQKSTVTDGVRTDREAALKLLELYPHWVKVKEEIYVFNDETGMWSNSKSTCGHIIGRFSKQLREKLWEKDRWVLSHKGWGDSTVKMKLLIEQLSYVLPARDEWLDDSRKTGLKKILFDNGYFDGETNQFHPATITENDITRSNYDPNIWFAGKVPHSYPTAEEIDNLQPYVEDIRKRLFSDVFSEPVVERVLWRYSVGIFGDKQKSMVANVGQTDGGKSTIGRAFKCGFGAAYVDIVNAETIAYNPNSSMEEAQRMRPFFLKQNRRLLFANELTMKRPIDGALIKKIAGGVDELEGRVHGGLETTFDPHFTLVLGMNDMPVVEPKDDAAVGRFDIVPYTKEFVDQPVNSSQLKKDTGLMREMDTLQFKQAFAQLIIQTYVKYQTTKTIPVVPEEMQEARSAYVGVKDDAIVMFLQDYVLTNKQDDFVSSESMQTWRTENKLTMSEAKWAIDLKKYASNLQLNCVQNSKQKKIQGRNIRGWQGIASKWDIVTDLELEEEGSFQGTDPKRIRPN